MKFFRIARKYFPLVPVAFSASAFAAPVDVTPLVNSVDFSTVVTAILAVAGIMVGVYVAWKAAKMVIAAVKGL